MSPLHVIWVLPVLTVLAVGLLWAATATVNAAVGRWLNR